MKSLAVLLSLILGLYLVNGEMRWVNPGLTADVCSCLASSNVSALSYWIYIDSIDPQFAGVYQCGVKAGITNVTGLWWLIPHDPGQNPASVPFSQIADYITKEQLALDTLQLYVAFEDMWLRDIDENRQYLLDIISLAKSTGLKISIWTWTDDWNLIFGDDFTDAALQGIPLIYAGDDVENYNDWDAISVWTTPSAKLIRDGNIKICNWPNMLYWTP